MFCRCKGIKVVKHATLCSITIFLLPCCSFKKNAGDLKETAAVQKTESLASIEESLFKAVESGNVSELKDILRENPDIDLNMRQKEVTPLFVALNRGDFEITALLMSYGASPFVPLNHDLSAFDTISKYSPRLKSVITYHADRTIGAFEKALVDKSVDEAMQFYVKQNIPCDLALNCVQRNDLRDKADILEPKIVSIVNGSNCDSLRGEMLEHLISAELLRVLKNGSRNFSVLKALVSRSPYSVSSVKLQIDQSLVSFNPVFLIKFRKFCSGFDQVELLNWKRELLTLFPNFSGIAYERESQNANSVEIRSGRALMSDFESENLEGIDLVEMATGIKGFFGCEGVGL